MLIQHGCTEVCFHPFSALWLRSSVEVCFHLLQNCGHVYTIEEKPLSNIQRQTSCEVVFKASFENILKRIYHVICFQIKLQISPNIEPEC